MATAWDDLPAVDVPPDEQYIDRPGSLATRLRSLADRPWLARYAGHAFVMLLLLVIVWDLVPSNVRAPSLENLLSPSPAAVGPSVAMGVARAPQEAHYLDRRAAPFTSRSINETLPIVHPERSARTSVFVYEVEPGDSTLGIAQKFGLAGTTLLWANPDLENNPDWLQVGQELNILPVDGAYHSVSDGESIESIAARYEVEPDAIANFGGNDLHEPYDLAAGQMLIIPGGVKPYVPRRVHVYSGDVPVGAKKGSGSFVWPMSGWISQVYWEGHHAIDIANAEGTPVVATDSGFVAAAQWTDVGYGRMVIIDHGNGFQTLYGHLVAYYVEVGQSVVKGELIGECGETGNATGPHLHFEVIKDGVRRNPQNYLP